MGGTVRRLALALVLAVAMVIPLPASAAGHCPEIDGKAFFDFGNNIGSARIVLDGERMRVPFFSTGFVETGPGMADIYFDWYFPDGVVSLVEHSTATPTGGPFGHFASSIDVLSGGEGTWQWSGTVDFAHQRARIEQLSGTLCID